MVFDRTTIFVRSFNADPRSVTLKTEMGLLVESETLANAVADSIENDIAAGNSWQVILKDDNKFERITVEDLVGQAAQEGAHTGRFVTLVNADLAAVVLRQGRGRLLQRDAPVQVVARWRKARL